MQMGNPGLLTCPTTVSRQKQHRKCQTCRQGRYDQRARIDRGGVSGTFYSTLHLLVFIDFALQLSELLLSPSHLLTQHTDMRFYPLRRLHPHASPLQPLPLPYRPALALPTHHHDHLGHRIRLQCCNPFFRWSSRRSFLLGLRRGGLFSRLSVLLVELVHA